MIEEKKDEVFLGKDRIIQMRIFQKFTPESVDKLLKNLEVLLKAERGKARVLVEIGTDSAISSSVFRKKVADRIRYLAENIGFKKGAVFGGGVWVRAAGSFVIAASRQKDLRMFKTQEEALKWLKR